MKTNVLFNMVMPSQMLKDVEEWITRQNEGSYQKISKAEFIRRCIADHLNRLKQNDPTQDNI